MTGWTVTLELDVTPDPTVEQIEAVADMLNELRLAPAVSGGPGHGRLSVTVALAGCVDAADVLHQAEHDVRSCLASAWQLQARTVAAEVLTWAEHDRRLAEPAGARG